MSSSLKKAVQQAKPILSLNRDDHRRRAIALYKAWYRTIPTVLSRHKLPVPLEDARAKLRQAFQEHEHITDLRVLDILLIKGQMRLNEAANIWTPACGIMDYWREAPQKKGKDFLSKFYVGQD